MKLKYHYKEYITKPIRKTIRLDYKIYIEIYNKQYIQIHIHVFKTTHNVVSIIINSSLDLS